MKAALHLAALGDVHERTLIAHHAAGLVANGGSGVQAHDGGAVLANKGDLVALDHGLAFDLVLDELALRVIDEDFRNAPFQNFLLGIVTEHAGQGGIDVQNCTVGSGDVDALLERFEEPGEAGFVFVEGGDIAPQNGDAVDFAFAHHGVRNAIEVKDRPLPLQPHLDDTGPLVPFQEPWHGATQQLGALPGAFLQEISDGPADNLLERRADKIEETPVDGADPAFERQGQQNVVERVNHVAITLLRPGDDFEELSELFVPGASLIVLLENAQQAPHFGKFLVLLPRVYAEENDEHNEKQGQFLEAVRQSADGVPGRPGISQGQEG